MLFVARCEQHKLEHFTRARGAVGGKGAVAVAADDALRAQLHHIVIEPVARLHVGIRRAGVAVGTPGGGRGDIAAGNARFRQHRAGRGFETRERAAELFHRGEAAVGRAALIDAEIRLIRHAVFLVDDEIGKLRVRGGSTAV